MTTPSQTVGPFFSIGLEHLRSTESPRAAAIEVRGRVLDGDGAGVPDAVLEVWQPDQADMSAARCFQRVFTGENGRFSFSVRPPARGGDTSHVVVLVFMRGLLRHLATRVYLSADDSDSILALVPQARRATLVARATADPHVREWDVVMQGPNETVFFAC